LGLHIELKFVKSHQDRDSNNLDTSALMNVRADILATIGLKKNNIKNILLLPSDNATINMKGKPITSNYKKVLKSAHQSINLRTYMKQSNNWNDDQIDTIWWGAHKKALYQMSENKKLIIKKFIHTQLPCNYRNSVMFDYKPPFCTLCNLVVEDQNHVLRCPKCPKRNIIRKKFKNEFRALLINSNTNETIARVLSFTINAWIEHKQLPKLDDLAPDASAVLRKAYNFQTTIGWEQLFKGRIDIRWGEMFNHEKQQQTYKQQSTKYATDTETWGSKIIILTWQIVLDCWFARNEVEHNLGENGAEITKNKLIEQITWINGKIQPETIHPYKYIDEENIMVDQLINIYTKDRLNRENEKIS
jgi:predicted RNA-binding Zn-ribbon protein involved in translation (DUF1610 family)